MHGSLARKLRVLRAERGLSVREVESLSGVAKETVSRAERGERQPLDRTLAKLARLYEVPLDDLLEEPLGERPLAGSPKTEASPSEASEAKVSEISDVEELGRMARGFKAEWNRLAAYDRVVKLPRKEYLETMRRLEEIEAAIWAVKERSRALREKLDDYEAEGVFELAGSI
jgi:transcriptional regulator with XRE-family HTH domain